MGDATYNVITSVYCDVPVAFISAQNRGYTKNLSERPQLLSANERIFESVFTKNLLAMHAYDAPSHEEIYSHFSVADWIATRAIINPDTVSFDSERVLAELDELFRILAPLMPKEISLFGTNNKKRVQLDQGRIFIAGTPIDKLPTGVISLLRIFQEIISVYSAWNGIMENPLENVFDMQGIVFIDEIEAHMHPKWQAEIIPLLKKSFPNTTFYIATHSPAIVATTESGEAYELKRAGENVAAHVLGNPRDWYLEDVFSVGFNLRFPRRNEGEESLEDKILAFSKLAQTFMGKSNDTDREKLNLELSCMYKKLSDQFNMIPDAEEDPRRDAVEQIWEYIQ
jgi:hypothetical protein